MPPEADSNMHLNFQLTKANHLLFKSRLRSLLYDGAAGTESEILYHYECPVGKWMYGYALSAFGNVPEMHELEMVHRELHNSARELVHFYREGKTHEAREGLVGLDLIADRLVSLLGIVEDKLSREIAPLNQAVVQVDESSVLIELLKKIELLDQQINFEVAEQIHARNKFHEAETSLRLAIEAANLGTFDWNLQESDFFSSSRLKEIFGFSTQESVSHKNLIDTFHPEDRHIRENAVTESLVGGYLAYEIRIIWPDKTIHWINVYGKVIHDPQQKPLRMYGTVMDVTPQKNALENLRESEVRFRLLADSMPQHVWTGDPDGNLNYFNKSVFDYSGLNMEQIRREGWLQIVHPDDRAGNIKEWMAAISTGNPFLFEHRFRRRDGEYRWQLSRAVPQKDDSGKIKMWVGTSTDIHDRKLFTDELESQVYRRVSELKLLNEELLRSNSELEQFIYVASHDLQEPLRKIQTFASGLLEHEHDNLSDKGKDYFKRMQAASARMQQLILDLLAFSRTNKAEKHFESTDLNEILSTVLEQLKETIQQKHAIIKCSPLPTLKIIPYQFEQLFTNLIANSLKFSKPSIPPQLEIGSRVIRGAESGQEFANPNINYYEISIKDNGIGFDPEYSERIFQVFQRLHGRHEYTGTGIGLAIVKKIVENHLGLISAMSKPGEGAAFSIYIPEGVN